MTQCEHIIGMLYNYEDTGLVNLLELLEHIKTQKDYANYELKEFGRRIFGDKIFTIEDYCDKRKGCDLERFEYCPLCGEKIDWKKIKEQNNETN